MLTTPFIRTLPTPIAIVGLGVSGRSLYKLLKALGFSDEQVVTFDDSDPTATFKTPAELFKAVNPKTLAISPGVPLSKPWIQTFIKGGGRITSEIEIAFSLISSEKIISVTGSIGKSTTVSLLGAGLSSFSPNSFVGGNLGTPLADYVSDVVTQKRPKAEWLVLELSSYQLENVADYKSDYSIVTYLTPNHLERYPNLESYYDTKWQLVNKTLLATVLNENGGDLANYANKKKLNHCYWTSRNDLSLKVDQLENCRMVGVHNIDNLAMAVKVARLASWPASSIVAMKSFRGLPHRLENIGNFEGITFINDSKATTIEAVKQATLSVAPVVKKESHLVLLLGGRDKNLPWEELNDLKVLPNLKLLFFGEFGETAKQKSNLPGLFFANLKDAIYHLKSICKLGDFVLFSPGGTSLDQFKNFEERGDFFKTEVSRHWSHP